MRVALVAFNDFTDLDLWLAWDLLHRVRIAGWQVDIVSDRRRVRSRTGVMIDVLSGLARTGQAQAVMFCGGPGAAAHSADPKFVSALKIEPRSQLLTAVNEGALFLGALGVLQGRRVTAPRELALAAALQAYGATIEATTLMEHGSIVTAAQSLATTHLAELIVTRLAGRGSARTMIDSVAPLDALNELAMKS